MRVPTYKKQQSKRLILAVRMAANLLFKFYFYKNGKRPRNLNPDQPQMLPSLAPGVH
jgi:hypothetical protein